jgi:hypothetical protein
MKAPTPKVDAICGALPDQFHDEIIGIVDDELVVAEPAVHGVDASAAIQRVIAVAAGQRVGSRAGLQRVVAAPAVEFERPAAVAGDRHHETVVEVGAADLVDIRDDASKKRETAAGDRAGSS